MERWGMMELAYQGKTEGNPFTERTISATFSHPQETKTVEGFYDGDGCYKVRFMPCYEGSYHYQVSGSFSDQTYEGDFEVTAPQVDNHGPVHVSNTFHFTYADGSSYYSLGTTCYVWHLQPREQLEQTIASLKASGFNKIRFCIFPKHYDYNLSEPPFYPFEGTPMDSSVLTRDNFFQYDGHSLGNSWDFTRFNPVYFRHIEDCILRLQRIGVEADLILFHPYDRWGFSLMDMEDDMRYLKYVTARFAAFRNVWWSLANEYDLLAAKTTEHWEAFGQYLQGNDPYQHLRSIHNCFGFYDHSRPWITHCSIQRQDIYKSSELTNEYREKYHKPIVLDEIAYEGNIQHGWGNINGQEMLRRFWEGVCRGGYPGHGETFLHPQGILWWSHGGVLHGESWKRMRFLHQIMAQTPGVGLKFGYRGGVDWDCVRAVPQDDALAEQTGYQLYYYSFMQPSFREFYLDDDHTYQVEVIDTWDMTITEVGTFKGRFRVPLPGKQYMAIRIRKAPEAC